MICMGLVLDDGEAAHRQGLYHVNVLTGEMREVEEGELDAVGDGAVGLLVIAIAAMAVASVYQTLRQPAAISQTSLCS